MNSSSHLVTSYMCQRNRYLLLRAFKIWPIIKLVIAQGDYISFKFFFNYSPGQTALF